MKIVIRLFVRYLSKVSSEACIPVKLMKQPRDYSARGEEMVQIKFERPSCEMIIGK